ncbi:MAG: hypothetical protein EOO71_04515 [Myxococcaceae bacterium]|nr:MAG: hypothetical protein EOO71_04515 [Myxococcaceae bacterium]
MNRCLSILCAVLVVFSALGPRVAAASPTFPYPWSDYSVVPVLFVPTDWNINSAEVQAEAAAINTAMAQIQGFYATHNNGATFVLNPVSIVQANGAKEAYGISWGPGNIYDDGVISITGNMEAAVMAELHSRGYPTPPAQNESGYSTMIFFKGAGGFAGGRAYTSGNGGQAIVGDWAIDSIQGQVAEGSWWWSGQRKQTGAVAHELGHAFGLPHPDSVEWENSSSVMGDWWDYPTIGLNDYDRSSLALNKSAFFTVPAVPANVTATALNGSNIRVNWTDTSGNETGFQLTNGVTTVSLAANTTTYTWGGLSTGTYMCFAVRSNSASGSSAWTPYACTTTPTLPAAPGGQSATPTSGTSIRVNWTDTSGNETGFQLTNGVTTVNLAANTNTYTWGGLSNGTYMCFAIRSLNAAGTSAWTPYACTTTPTLPTAPTNPTATALSTTSIRVNWTDTSGNETGFQLTNGVSTVNLAANTTTYTWGGLASRTYMCFAIRSTNVAGSSAWTPYACTTTR